MTDMPPLAVVTMVYDDDVYLDIFLRHWTRFLPRSNIFVLMHANYERFEAMAEGCNTMRIRRPETSPESEQLRWRMVSQIVSGLTYQFGRALYTDVDEIITVDPDVAASPVEYICGLTDPVVAPMGVDLVHVPDREPLPYDPARPILGQRRYFAFTSWYAKPAIVSEPIRWGSGGHNCNRKHVLDPALTLFHLRLFDEGIYRARADARLDLVTDDATGGLIPGLGGRTWRSEGDHLSLYRRDTMDEELARIEKPGMMRNAMQLKKMHDDLYILHHRDNKRLRRLPSRYEGVF
ncbi:hypothetical protein RM543_06745 [Roseicyclus sp. F158]|uniref:Glycosyl transferase family 2 n=1 Tax=Tropicimonas omnivorans TaxID=3075590 RepID=A0ABU3DF93_9RHOB|nr:hypothetical protein [Roseicyclus sp. F158]MDT0682375.1 hypothetical protein [Roseicyclus sp. F158]